MLPLQPRPIPRAIQVRTTSGVVVNLPLRPAVKVSREPALSTQEPIVQTKQNERLSKVTTPQSSSTAALKSAPRRKCSVCAHSESNSISVALAAGRSVRFLEEKYGLSKSALDRHSHHMSEELVLDRISVMTVSRESLSMDRVSLYNDLKAMFVEAMLNNPREAIRISAGMVRVNELLSKGLAEQHEHTLADADSIDVDAIMEKVKLAFPNEPEICLKIAEIVSPTKGSAA